MRQIKITLVGGVIEDIENIPDDVQILIQDYDVHPEDRHTADRDDAGKPCYRSIWGNPDADLPPSQASS